MNILQTTMAYLALAILIPFTGMAPVTNQGSVPIPEIYIPAGMPIEIETTPEQTAEMMKINIKSVWGEGVTKVSTAQFMFGSGLNSDRATTRVSFVSSWKRDQPADIAWVIPQTYISRVVIIVESLETKTGRWEIDTSSIGKDARAALLANILETRQVPPGRFVPGTGGTER